MQSTEQAIEAHLSSALAEFWQVSTGATPALSAVRALDALANAALLGDLPLVSPLICAQLEEAIQRATPRLAETAARSFPADHTYLLMTAAAGLVSDRADHLTEPRLLYVALLRSELGAMLCRQQIAATGDPLVRNIAFNRASAASLGWRTVH